MTIFWLSRLTPPLDNVLPITTGPGGPKWGSTKSFLFAIEEPGPSTEEPGPSTEEPGPSIEEPRPTIEEPGP